MPSIEETRAGIYDEPFDLKQYGAFVTKADGTLNFTAASMVDGEDAKKKAVEYYERMARYPKNNMDMTDLDRITIRIRTVRYFPWDS